MEAPPGVDLAEDRRSVILAGSMTTWALAITAVILRIMSRRMRNIKLWLDDWLIIASLIPACAHILAMSVYAVSRGLGKHIWVAPPDAVYAWAIGLFIAEVGYTLTLMSVKWSILAFYWRSFSVRESAQIPILILAVIVLIWSIAVLIVTALQCQPTRAWWDRFHPVHPMHPSEYKCTVDSTKFFYGNAIPTIITDVMMLALPIPYVLRLQLPRGQKVALIGIFLVGIFVTIVSIVRLNYLLHTDLSSPDITWNFVDVGLWSILEGNIATICACLPFLRPILSKIPCGMFNLASIASNKQQQSSSNPKPGHPDQSDHLRSWEGDGKYGKLGTHVRSYSRTAGRDEHPFVYLADNGSERDMPTSSQDSRQIELTHIPAGGRTSPIDGILVTREIHVV
ncbi:hypothetical protein PT974_01351 [Cladobotryum mycophilum]|uniref:Rhodopsin domain-containing protein n=1 Tax=Cladobotryum mycophilum TaxID=491253 RepID=A0ABR0T3G9_9HYPO